MAKTILFDLDGTLTDSGEGIINCAWGALAHFGIPLPPREQMRVFVGPPLTKTFAEFGVAPEDIDEALVVYRKQYLTTGMYQNTPYPGIEDMLMALKARGCTLFVATSKPEPTAITILEHFGLAQYFDIICGASFDRSRNSKSAVIAHLLTQVDDLSDALMVGDTAFDVIGAAEHKIQTIGVAWGYGTVEEMEKAGARAIAYSTAELLELLTK